MIWIASSSALTSAASFNQRLKNLFAAMFQGGRFGEHDLAWFAGGLIVDTDVVPLTLSEAAILAQISHAVALTCLAVSVSWGSSNGFAETIESLQEADPSH